MKIVTIFAEKLFSFHYEGEVDNEFDRLMELWTNPQYLKKFAEDNEIADVEDYVLDRLSDAEQIQDVLDEIETDEVPLEQYFKPLFDKETGIKILSLRKGKLNHNHLRIYAIKIDTDCFVITGGAIKMSQAMQDFPDTQIELDKLYAAQRYLKDNGVFDIDSFFELLREAK
ncbi:MAG: hypothetical protein KBC43_08060 [Bacteroidales bacterium]|nr:hypothetical protein [Bacteroidales bacterium]